FGFHADIGPTTVTARLFDDPFQSFQFFFQFRVDPNSLTPDSVMIEFEPNNTGAPPVPVATNNFGSLLEPSWQLNDFLSDAMVLGVYEFTSVSELTDFNEDGFSDIIDIDLMLAEGPIASGVPVVQGVNDMYDMTGDDVIDLDDRDAWLAEAAMVNGFTSPYKLGDATLNGVVDGLDFIEWNEAKFMSSLSWADGEYNGDGVVDGLDFIEWNATKFTSSMVPSVPEPGAWVLVMLALLFCRRHR
ncbi:unnamed protein product, partial [marine sediment metagenome]